jgi:uncharacterized membrane protein YfcA
MWAGDPLLTGILLAAGGLAAGAINAVAGGGSFITLPLLVLAGLPAVSANATGTLALLPGYLASARAFRPDIRRAEGVSLPLVAVVCLAGGATGSVLLLITPSRTFDRVIPWLLLLATAALALGPRLRSPDTSRRRSRLRSGIALLGVAVYGGYFNGGLGIILLATLNLLGIRNLNTANGIKNIASAAITGVAIVVYGLGSLISWPHALALTIGTVIGGYFGARLSRQVNQERMRWGIVVVGCLIAALFFAR